MTIPGWTEFAVTPTCTQKYTETYFQSAGTNKQVHRNSGAVLVNKSRF